MRTFLTIGAVVGLTTAAAAQQPDLPGEGLPPGMELAPAPHAATPAVRVVSQATGYHMILSRPAADRLRQALKMVEDEKGLADTIQDWAKSKENAGAAPETVGQLQLLAFAVRNQLPGFKKALGEKMGPNGVTVKVTGLAGQNILGKPRPKLERAAAIARQFIPDDARETLDGIKSMASTTPLFWTVEPRE